jgi:hypothetical protein
MNKGRSLVPLSSYMIQSFQAIQSHPMAIPDEPGIYAMVLDRPEALEPALSRAGLQLDGIRLGSRPLLYLGATDDSLRRRLKCHMSNDTCRSTFRMSVGALLLEDLRLVVSPLARRNYFGFEPDSEARLSKWIARNISVALRLQHRAREAETKLIRRMQPPLNIAARGDVPGAGAMLALRRQCQKMSARVEGAQ